MWFCVCIATPSPSPSPRRGGNGPQHLPPPALEVGQKVGSEREGKGKETPPITHHSTSIRETPPTRRHQSSRSPPGPAAPHPPAELDAYIYIYPRYYRCPAPPRPPPRHTHTPLLSSVSSPSRPKDGPPQAHQDDGGSTLRIPPGPAGLLPFPPNRRGCRRRFASLLPIPRPGRCGLLAQGVGMVR